MPDTSLRVGDLLRRDTAAAIEEYGQLDGTDSAKEIAGHAIDNPRLTIEQLAEQTGYSVPWVVKVVERVDSDFVSQYLDAEIPSETADNRQPTRSLPETELVSPEAVRPRPDAPLFEWEADGVRWVELLCTEYCGECDALRRVVTAVPADDCVLIDPPQCGHDLQISTVVPDWARQARQLRPTLANAFRNIDVVESHGPIDGA